MNVSLVFSYGLAPTLLMALVVVWCLNSPLRKQLQLCGKAERAEFWKAFGHVTVLLTPAISAVSLDPSSGPVVPPLLAVVSQVQWGFVGRLPSLLMMGWILGRFSGKSQMAATPTRMHKKVGGEV